MTPAAKVSYDSFLKRKELLDIEWDATTLQECARVRARDVQSDFETQVKQDIQAWIKKQPPEKFWSTPADSAKQFWNERLN